MTPGSPARWRSTSPSRCDASSPSRSSPTRCAGRSSRTRWPTAWSTVAASRSPIERWRRPARHPSRWLAPTSCAARSSTSPATWPTGRGDGQRRQHRCPDERSTSSSAGSSTARSGGSSRRDRHARHRRRGGPVPSGHRGPVRSDPGTAPGTRAGSPAPAGARLRGQGDPRGPRARRSLLARLVLAARLHRDRRGHRRAARPRRRRLLPDLRHLLHRRDAHPGHLTAPR